MMSHCITAGSGAVELYFYGELTGPERAEFERHADGCDECRATLADLTAIGRTLATRQRVAAPDGGDWAPFMARLQSAIASDASSIGTASSSIASGAPAGAADATQDLFADAARGDVRAATGRAGSGATRLPWSRAGWVATAAVLALATTGVVITMRSREVSVRPATVATVPAAPAFTDAAAFEALSEEHFERSKLVVLGLAAKDPLATRAADWNYERELAANLLNDTRLYRIAAEDRGLQPIAGVMRDLELVLIQASCTDVRDPKSLGQIQRLIRKRDLVEKMDAVSMPGL
jgi:hypothetical protein